MKTILIVDDEKDLLELCADAFEMEGFKVHPFSNALDAVNFYRDNICDAIISDSLMPQMTGLEFFSAIKGTLKEKNTAFFLCTGQIDLDEEKLVADGVKGIISKPFDILEMVEEVKSKL